MIQSFDIYVDKLQGGAIKNIDEKFDPNFLEIKEKGLKFTDPVHTYGQAYLTPTHLIISLKVKTYAQMICSICNEFTKLSIYVDKFYLTEELSKIKATFNFQQPLRESIILELPSFAECMQGNCPERETLKPYLRKHQRLPFKNFLQRRKNGSSQKSLI